MGGVSSFFFDDDDNDSTDDAGDDEMTEIQAVQCVPGKRSHNRNAQVSLKMGFLCRVLHSRSTDQKQTGQGHSWMCSNSRPFCPMLLFSTSHPINTTVVRWYRSLSKIRQE